MQDEKWIDTHCHVLPGLDDGSPDVETSIEILHIQAEQKIGIICATPHYNARQNDIRTFCALRSEALTYLRRAAPDGLPRVIPAAEVAYFPHMEECALDPLCVEGTHTLMLEMPFSDWTDLQTETVEVLALDRHYQVVLVHPERFCFSGSNRDKLRRLSMLPIGMQVNAGSLLRWSTRKLALSILQMTQYPLLGSDCHNLTSRPPNLKKGREVIRKKLGEDFLNQMDQNAEMVVGGLESLKREKTSSCQQLPS